MKYLVCLLVLALTLGLATSAMAAYVEAWEMDYDMTTVQGTCFGNVLIADGGGSGTYGMDGFDYAGGIGTFLDDGASDGNQGVALKNGTALLGHRWLHR